MAKDNLFKQSIAPFQFNHAVADVFDDMISRSVPMYQQILQQIAQLTVNYCDEQHRVYDLGCSLGGLVPVLQRYRPLIQYCGIDSSNDMIQKANQVYASPHIQFQCADALDIEHYTNAGAIICNLTLQFMTVPNRMQLMERCMDALMPNGAFIMVEKIHQKNPSLQSIYNQSFYSFKEDNGYSQVEIKNKEAALNGVLMSQTESFYEQALNQLPCTWSRFFQWYNFIGYIGIKS